MQYIKLDAPRYRKIMLVPALVGGLVSIMGCQTLSQNANASYVDSQETSLDSHERSVNSHKKPRNSQKTLMASKETPSSVAENSQKSGEHSGESKDLDDTKANSADESVSSELDQAIAAQSLAGQTPKLSKKSLYDLLVAEIAGKRQDYEMAQHKYAEQAEVTQNPDIAARATRVALYRQDYEAALKSAKLWQTLAPEDPYPYQALAEVHLHFLDWQAFEVAMVRMLQLDDRMRMEFLLAQMGKLDVPQLLKLISHLKSIQHQHPAQGEIMFVLANMHQKQGDIPAALQQLDRLIKLEPEHYPSYLLKSKLLALEAPEKAIAFLESALQEHFSDNKTLNVLYARLLIRLKEYPKAEQAFLRLTQLFPNESSFHLSLGLLYLERKHYPGAIDAFSTLIKHNHRLDEAHFYLGRVHFTQKRYNQALHHLFLVMKGREFLPAQSLITKVLEMQGKTPQARMHLAHMRSKNPSYSASLFIIEADMLRRYQQPEAAFDVLSKAIDLKPDQVDLRYTRALLAEKLNRLDVVESDLRWIIEQNPKNSAALNALGYTLADRTDRTKEALELIKRARDIDPDDPAIIDSLGWVYYRLGDFPKAVALLKEAYEAYPDHEVAAHLGEVLWMMGRQDEAKVVWSEGLEMKPSSEVLKDTLMRLLGEETL